jgi:hypothetical protein
VRQRTASRTSPCPAGRGSCASSCSSSPRWTSCPVRHVVCAAHRTVRALCNAVPPCFVSRCRRTCCDGCGSCGCGMCNPPRGVADDDAPAFPLNAVTLGNNLMVAFLGHESAVPLKPGETFWTMMFGPNCRRARRDNRASGSAASWEEDGDSLLAYGACVCSMCACVFALKSLVPLRSGVASVLLCSLARCGCARVSVSCCR